MAPKAPPTLSGTGCDVRCPAVALVMVQKATPLPADFYVSGGKSNARPTAPDAPPSPYAYLSLCGHHYHANDVLLALDGWKVVADLRTWKGPTS